MILESLRQAVGRLHDCEADHLETLPVIEIFRGQTVWQGDVEVFGLRGHPKATRCYAWTHKTGENDKNEQVVTVLEIPPVSSAQTAVKAAIISEARRIKSGSEKEEN